MLWRIKDAEIYYEIVGEGKPVLIIHGCAPDHRLMMKCMESVFQKYEGYQRIYIDLPGMGKSNAPDWINSSDHILEVLTIFIEEIIPKKDFLLVGESFGGYLARGILSKMFERVNGLLLICPVVVALTKERRLPDKQIIVQDKEFLNTLTSTERNEFSELAVVANKNTYKRFKEEIKPGLDVANYEFIERLQKNHSLTMEFHRKKYEKPVLLLAGRQDISVGYRDIIEIIEDYPRATLAVLDMAGHNLQIEQPELFESLVGEWITRTKQQNL
ncbi:2-hydroxy-6-oxo-6-phenylhexa-2,4-dienoate hydrolase [Bacillus wiedmannii]|uniref:alpha/beta fold hydrolase n=1 Tax=Bacillus wiedmannii TaxID=1890302 RepID=UPI000BECCF5C|nr:alpha/beta hydrolase [Bacillus wiedmannii]PEA80037.1 2-hydroxy-6-oxo-6-phenylhexa-2,4-dienoate hydrolase [Bacillus wiedmannii]PEJ46981.1 2-hydroxy-6-oxo-6-phenylhexa-2,4-dienoate hydrolase [Bacillus wiedmannii]PEL44302.1 2-hydroxy-6-oxo-6-phenylhexa-2,4-dienoate hydrolase [Bacillus wiedmannii]PEO99589.1 2-hydroxy-6-oxo-6-phenylhexa-2,4-dienoate hydrolase [Bacillus wiedmannii]PGA31221.1 2-hydroxy-6-oxo-6-phenylhexa-2,4-dienoate hydrolase [Bacillus wiedmannii]